MPTPITRERFLEMVSPEPNSGCWLWLGCVSRGGYGVMTARRRHEKAHRFSYEMHVGPIPDDHHLDHLCRVRSCVNPAHLEPVTPRENWQRGGKHRRDTHCGKGHELSGDNLYIWRGKRSCRECVRAAGLKYSRERRRLLAMHARERAA